MAVQTFTLKVKINCCSKCPMKAKRKLLKIKEVASVSMDTAKELVTITGDVDPAVLVEKFAKWGKKAELWSFQREHNMEKTTTDDNNCCNINNYSDSFQQANVANDTDSGAPRSQNNAVIIRATKKRNWCCIVKKIASFLFGHNSASVNSPVTNRPPGKWHFPRMTMYDLAASRPNFYGTQFRGLPFYGRQTLPPPPMYGPRPLLSPYDYSPSAPLINPMIHYTSYEDNYPYWRAP